MLATIPAQLDSAGRTNPWLGFWFAHDPLPVARSVRQPMLILQGDTDTQVSPEQADTLAIAVRASGNTRVTVRHFPATNHLFLTLPLYPSDPSHEKRPVRTDVDASI